MYAASARSTCRAPDASRPVWFGVAAAVILTVSLFMAYLPIHGPACLFKALLHLPCPTCGMTRSLMALWHLHPALSFRYHPLGIPLAVLCGLLIWQPLRRSESGRAAAALFDDSLFGTRSLLIGVGILLAVWLLRLGFVLSGSSFFLW